MRTVIEAAEESLIPHEERASEAKGAAEKLGIWGEIRGRHPSGAKAHVDIAGVMYGLKPVPFNDLSFPAACKARLYSELFAARLKSRPFKTIVRTADGMSLSANWIAWFALAGCFALAQTSGFAQVNAEPPASTAVSPNKPRDASLDDYRAHLRLLSALVDGCSKARDVKNCDPGQVGADDEVPVSSVPNAERRLVRYGWVRVLLSKAQDKDAPPPKTRPAVTEGSETWENVRPAPPTTTQLLKNAERRLANDLAQADAAAAAVADHTQERDVMKQVLAEREFRNLEEPTAKDSALEKVGNWLNGILESAVKASARAPWLGRALVWGFVVVVCLGLVWGLLQLERRWRIRLVPEDHGPAAGAASAIHWQLWLEDAQRAAAAGQWREAIHFLYWAAISRLESKRLWPADRARTPREYLALVAADDPRQPGLATLTGSFERVWYGGRPAGEGDYLKAEQIASALISGTGAARLGAEGGAQQ
jgi:hypothetical protein